MSGTPEAVAMATAQCPYQVGQTVKLIGQNGPEDARVLAIHRYSRGVEIVVRTTHAGADEPGRTVTLFTTSGRSSWLLPVADTAAEDVAS